MTYAHSGRFGDDGIVLSEKVSLALVGDADSVISEEIELDWKAFGYTDHVENKHVISGSAFPFVVQRATTVSHETDFLARTVPCIECTDEERYRNFLLWDDVVKQLDETKGVRLTFVATLKGGRSLVEECYVPLDRDMRSHMRRNGYLTRGCHGKSAT